jgi:ABC-type multidrug transport system ATPase subunit
MFDKRLEPIEFHLARGLLCGMLGLSHPSDGKESISMKRRLTVAQALITFRRISFLNETTRNITTKGAGDLWA